MNLFELSLPDTRFKANHVLIDAGYERLGVGSWGMVYRKPGSPYVLKVFSSTDEAYLSYLALIKNHSNIHFPKTVGKLVQVTPAYYGVRLEPLEKLISKELNWFIFTVKTYIQVLHMSADEFEKLGSYYKKGVSEAKEYIDKNPDLKKACSLISTLIPPFHLDIDENNIMRRGNTFVFSDPLF